jgi:hypothetical protein
MFVFFWEKFKLSSINCTRATASLKCVQALAEYIAHCKLHPSKPECLRTHVSYICHRALVRNPNLRQRLARGILDIAIVGVPALSRVSDVMRYVSGSCVISLSQLQPIPSSASLK